MRMMRVNIYIREDWNFVYEESGVMKKDWGFVKKVKGIQESCVVL